MAETVVVFGRTWHLPVAPEVPCEVCGCEGNRSCGHAPPQWAIDDGTECALDRAGVCPCCNTTREGI